MSNTSKQFYFPVTKNLEKVGFVDSSGKQMNFGFTSDELAEIFIREAHALGMLKGIDRVLPLTFDEYFNEQEKNATNIEIATDVDPKLLNHSTFSALKDMNN